MIPDEQVGDCRTKCKAASAYHLLRERKKEKWLSLLHQVV